MTIWRNLKRMLVYLSKTSMHWIPVGRLVCSNIFAKAAAKSSESSGANPNHSADDSVSDDIEISSTAGPSAGPPTSTADQTSSSSQDKSESETSSLIVSKSTPAQDKVNASVDHLTKKIEWHKSSLESGIVEDASKTQEKITSLTEERDGAVR